MNILFFQLLQINGGSDINDPKITVNIFSYKYLILFVGFTKPVVLIFGEKGRSANRI